MKINLGCGTDIRSGFVNVDARDDIGADVVCDISDKLPFKSDSTEEIVAQDVLEHLTLQQQKFTLSEIYRVLKFGGKLEVRIPNVDAIWQNFSDDPETRNLFLYGDTTESGVWGSHKSGHTAKSFVVLCASLGLKLISKKLVETNFEFTFEKDNQPSIKKILFINQSLGIGGAESFNRDLIYWFRKRGVQVSSYVATAKFSQMLRSNVYKTRVVLDIIGDWKGLLKAVFLWPFGLLEYLEIVWSNRDSDIVYMSGFIEKIIVTPLAYLFKIPVVWVEFGPIETVFRKFFGLSKFLYRLFSNLPDYLIEPTQHTKNKNINQIRYPLARTEVIPCGLDIDIQKYSKIKPTRYSVCCVSRLEHGKGQDILIAAWSKVLEKIPQAQLYIVGEGDKLVGGPQVHFTGRVPDALQKMAESEVCVFPSVWPLEGFGLVMIEAMAVGRPVVAFNHNTAPEILDDKTGILTTPDKLAESIVKLLKDPTLSKKLGKAGQAKYLKEFTIEKIAPQYLDVFIRAKMQHYVKNF